MTLTVTQSTDSLLRLTMAGSLDIAGSQQIENRFLALTAAGDKSVIVDFSEITYMASFGMRLLVQAFKSLDRKGKKLVVLKPQAEVAKIFSAAGLTDLLFITDDESAALSAAS